MATFPIKSLNLFALIRVLGSEFYLIILTKLKPLIEFYLSELRIHLSLVIFLLALTILS